MKYYAMIADEDSKLVSVGTGTDTAFYESIGMKLMGVEHGYDGNWYVAGYAPVKPQEVVEAEALAEAKAERAALVEKATVEVDGMVFDADETSQNRLMRGIVCSIALGLAPDETTEWTLADNSSAMVTAQQMARALLAAGQYQTSVWRMPYEA